MIMKLSDKLIELRKEKGWSQEDFAEKLEVSRQAISRWENETALPDVQNILRISKLFNVTVDYLLNDDYEEETPDFVTETSAEAPASSAPEKKHSYWYLIAAMGVALLAALVVIIIMVAKRNDAPSEALHSHLDLKSVRENEIAPTCSAEGSYDEVLYCAECNEEIMRTTKIVAKCSHALADGVKENVVSATCAKEGSFDEVFYCTVCDEEIMRTHRSVAKLSHILSNCVRENVVASTCTKAGSYQEVVHCTRCDAVLVRTSRTTEKLTHQFQNKQCVFCGEAQPSEGLVYMSNGNGTCFVSNGSCMDENIIIPEYSPNDEKVVGIKAYAFSGNNIVKSIRIPETVTAIGEGAFQDCRSLESINLPTKLTVIAAWTFYGCTGLKEITIPSKVYKIGVEAFADCVSCQSIVIPASVTQIGKNAFRNFSACDGTATFAIYQGWSLYDDSGNYVTSIDFENGHATPIIYLTFMHCDYTWKRK